MQILHRDGLQPYGHSLPCQGVTFFMRKNKRWRGKFKKGAVFYMSKTNRRVFIGEAAMRALQRFEERGNRLEIGDSVVVSLKNCVIIITREEDDPATGEKIGIYAYRPIRIKGKIGKSEMELIDGGEVR